MTPEEIGQIKNIPKTIVDLFLEIIRMFIFLFQIVFAILFMIFTFLVALVMFGTLDVVYWFFSNKKYGYLGNQIFRGFEKIMGFDEVKNDK